jgi:hypothetical protein
VRVMRVAAGPDLDRARRDVAYFAQLCKWPMTEVQLAAIRLDTLVTAILAPRQSGKSHALALLVAWWAVSRRDQFVLIVSGGDTAAVRPSPRHRWTSSTSSRCWPTPGMASGESGRRDSDLRPPA